MNPKKVISTEVPGTKSLSFGEIPRIISRSMGDICKCEQLILSLNVVGTIAAAAKAVASLLLSDDDDVWRPLIDLNAPSSLQFSSRLGDE